MYPSREKKYAGIFVKNQFEYLSTHDKKNEYLVLALERAFTGKFGSLKKYFLFYKKSLLFNLQKKPDVIHLHFFSPLAPLVWLFKKIIGSKIVVTSHGSDLYRRMNNKVIKKFYSYILKDFDYIICVGTQLKHDFEETFKVKVSEVLPAGVNSQVFYPLHIKKEFDFIFVGSLLETKGFDIILNLLTITAEKGYKWCIVGSGEYEEQLNNIRKDLVTDCVFVKGIDQDELNILYNKAKWLFFPSRTESFGLVASESVFAGTPIICSYVGGLKEQLVEGINGFGIYDLNDVDAMAGLLEKAYTMQTENYEAMVKNCSSINRNYSLEYVCDRLKNIYETI